MSDFFPIRFYVSDQYVNSLFMRIQSIRLHVFFQKHVSSCLVFTFPDDQKYEIYLYGKIQENTNFSIIIIIAINFKKSNEIQHIK